MKLISPSVELWSEEDIAPASHIARCARLCYGKKAKAPDKEADEALVARLKKSGHLSMFRHASAYFNFRDYELIPCEYDNCPWVFQNESFLSTNMQEVSFSENYMYWFLRADCRVTPKDFLRYCLLNPELFPLYRLTFCITTQISTSRELNRVSPNNIAERSTRFCSSKEGLEICKPWWIDSSDDDPANKKGWYIEAMNEAEASYMVLFDKGMKPEDARGVLPLDTATKCVYTYSVREWQHIIDLRYYGKTGKPHPNAKLIIGMVRDQINDFANKHHIAYKL